MKEPDKYPLTIRESSVPISYEIAREKGFLGREQDFSWLTYPEFELTAAQLMTV